MRWTLLFIILLPFALVHADDQKYPSYIPWIHEPDKTEALENFGLVYGGQWVYYVVGQQQVIKENGSFKNWHSNMLSPHFDRDNFDYNIFRHSITGNYYFLFYRSRGYDYQNAFLWSFLSSLAFEFTIETVTERPSYQDMYQTPVMGTVLGVGVEKLSRYLHERDTWWGHGLGYILNPFTLIPAKGQPSVSISPVFHDATRGLVMTYRY